jgi:hypothetical protein
MEGSGAMDNSAGPAAREKPALGPLPLVVGGKEVVVGKE